jgi:hypothetical protein
MKAFTDFIRPYASTFNATPGNSQTVSKVTLFYSSNPLSPPAIPVLESGLLTASD